jgi:O-antigen/teichoic acid export membrane protein
MIKINIFSSYYSRYSLYFKSASIYLLASLFAVGLKILINPLLAKNLSHEDYAIIGYFGSFSILFLPLLTFMIFAYFQRNFYLVSDEKRQRIANTIIISLAGIGFFASIFILIGFYIYFRLTHVHFPFWPFAIFLVYQITFNNFLTFLQVNYRLKREAKKFAQITIASSLLWLVFAILLVVVFKLGAKGNMGANLLVAILIGIYSVKRTLTKLEFDLHIFKDLIRFCWPLTLSSLLWYFLSGVDSAMLEKLNKTNTFALYNIGLSLSGSLGLFYTAIAQTFEPDIYKAISDRKLKRMAKIILGLICINAIPVLLFILFASPLTHLLTAGRYTNAASFARITALKNISMSMYYSVLTVIVGFGFTKADLGLRAIGAVFSIIMFTVLIKYFEFYGAAWGQIISFLFMSILGLFFILYKLKRNKLYVNCV